MKLSFMHCSSCASEALTERKSTFIYTAAEFLLYTSDIINAVTLYNRRWTITNQACLLACVYEWTSCAAVAALKTFLLKTVELDFSFSIHFSFSDRQQSMRESPDGALQIRWTSKRKFSRKSHSECGSVLSVLRAFTGSVSSSFVFLLQF